jgi:hypothetical protein
VGISDGGDPPPGRGRGDALVRAEDALIAAIEANRTAKLWWQRRGDLDELHRRLRALRNAREDSWPT